MSQKQKSSFNHEFHDTPNPEGMSSRVYLLILLFVLSLTLVWIGRPEIVTRGEGREALVARSLFEQGEWVLPRGYGGVVPSKPPALHWLIGAAASLVGEINEFVCRLPSALASLVFVLFFASWVAHRDPKRVWPSVIVLVTSFEWFRASVSCRVDMLHAAALAAAVILGSGTYAPFSLSRARWIAVVALSVISTLTKGPVGALLSAAILFIFGYWEHRRLFINIISAGSLVLGAINIAAIWYLAAYFQGGEAFVEKVSYENLQRFMSTMDDSPHRHSAWYLLGMGIVGFMPWSLPFVVQFVRFLFKSKGASKGFIAAPPGYTDGGDAGANDGGIDSSLMGLGRGFKRWIAYLRKEALDRWNYLIAEPETRLSLVAILVLFTFYAIPSGKRGVYLLAAYPFGAVIIGRALLESHKVRDCVLAWMTKAFRIVIRCISFALALVFLTCSLLLTKSFFPLIEEVITYLPLAQLDKIAGKLPLSELLFYLTQGWDLVFLALIVAAIFIVPKLYRKLYHQELSRFKSSDNYQSGAVSREIFGSSAFSYCCLLLLINAVIFPAATNSVGVSHISQSIDRIVSEHLSNGQLNNSQKPQAIYSYGSELYSLAFYSRYKYKSVTPLVESVGFGGFKEGSFIALERRYLKKLEGLLAKHGDRVNQSVIGAGPEFWAEGGCFKIGVTYDLSAFELLDKGRIVLLKISC